MESVRKCQRAGIAVKMITGDHLVTARVIAKSIGINHSSVAADVSRLKHSDPSEKNQNPLTPVATNELAAISGRELEKISDEQMPDIAERTAVFARVAPEQKLRLVRALQSRNHVVAMTGDGVNDAPALKQADIGVAMGISGTDVAKGAAAMILTDDNFASIEAAVEEGRGVFDDLTKFIVWIIPTNLGEALMLLSAILLGLPLPMLPLQLLWINLTDTLLGLSLAFEPKEKDVMDRPPRDPVRPLMTFPLIMRTGLVSLIMVVGGISTFLWELRVEQAGIIAARTAAINVVVVVQIGYLFACRSLHHSLLNVGLFTNRWAIFGSLAMLGAQLLLTYVPVMNKLFHTTALGGESWLRIIGVAAIAFLAVEFEKWIRFGGDRGKRAIPR
jgi:magnesium-transporting ATPase (P-type)